MPTPATLEKRQDLTTFIQRVLAPEPAVQGVVGIGSIASGLARPDSDIDAVVFLDPLDWYIVPAEFKWRPSDGTYHSIFSQEVGLKGSIQFDFARLDLGQWADPSFEWPEGRRAELSEGWVAFDRSGQVSELIAQRTAYADKDRAAKLDEAIVWLDQHLGGDGPKVRWESLAPIIAHDRLGAAYDWLVQALFAYNRRWRPWRNRVMASLLKLAWLPDDFKARVLSALNAPAPEYAGYAARVDALRSLFDDLLARLIADGDYNAEDPVGQAFIRGAEGPGWAWDMDAWNDAHRKRSAGKS